MKKLIVTETDINGCPIYQVEVPADASIQILFTESNLVSPFLVSKEVRKEYLEGERGWRMREPITKRIDDANSNAIVIADNGWTHWFNLGSFTDRSFWIENESGEGMQISSGDLYKVIDKCFNDHF